MPDWRQRIEAAFANTGIDRDILEELAQHAEATYEAHRADGLSADQATARIDVLIEGWRTNPAALNRIVKRAAAVVPPVASHSGMLAGAGTM